MSEKKQDPGSVKLLQASQLGELEGQVNDLVKAGGSLVSVYAFGSSHCAAVALPAGYSAPEKKSVEKRYTVAQRRADLKAKQEAAQAKKAGK